MAVRLAALREMRAAWRPNGWRPVNVIKTTSGDRNAIDQETAPNSPRQVALTRPDGSPQDLYPYLNESHRHARRDADKAHRRTDHGKRWAAFDPFSGSGRSELLWDTSRPPLNE